MADKNDTNSRSLSNIIAENLFDSLTLMYENKLSTMKKDETKKAVIVDISEQSDDKYKVRFDGADYTAYDPLSKKYALNTAVYVKIPQGDTDNQGIIECKVVDEDSENALFNYQFPFANFVKVRELASINAAKSKSYGFRANDPYDSYTSLEELDSHIIIGQWSNDYTEGVTIGTKLGISLNLQTLLNTYNLGSGSFWFDIIVDGMLKASGEESSKQKTKTYTWSTSEMYGNPFAYTIPAEQQLVFDISEFQRVDSVTIIFNQDLNFIDEYGNLVPYVNEDIKVIENIIVSGIQAYFGFNSSELQHETLYLITYDDLKYGQNQGEANYRDNLDRRTLYLAYVYYDKDAKEWKVCDDLNEFNAIGAEIYWYIKDENWTMTSLNAAYDDSINYHKYCGNFYAPMSAQSLPQGRPMAISTPNEETYSDTFYTFVANLEISSYRFRAAVVRDGQHILSDVVTFTNTNDQDAADQALYTSGNLIMKVGMLLSDENGGYTTVYPDDSFTNFLVYDENNRVLYTDDKRRIEYEDHILVGPDQIKYSDITYFVELFARQSEWNDNTQKRDYSYIRLSDMINETDNNYTPMKITWNIPTEYTMLNVSKLTNNFITDCTYYNRRANMPANMDYSMYYTDAEYESEFGVNKSNKVGVETRFDIDKMTTRVFKINDLYTAQYINNTITATVQRNGQTASTQRTFLFGRALAQGCDYTPIITITEPNDSSYILTNQPYTLECIVYDRYGNEYQGDYQCFWSFVGENKPERNTNENADVGKYVLLDKIAGVTKNNILSAIMGNDVKPFVVTVTVRGLVEWDLTAQRGIRVGNNADFMHKSMILCADRVEFNSDGQNPHYYEGKFICQAFGAQNRNNEKVYLYPDWQLHINDDLKNFVTLRANEKSSLQYYLVKTEDWDSKKRYCMFNPTTFTYYGKYYPKPEQNQINPDGYVDDRDSGLLFWCETKPGDGVSFEDGTFLNTPACYEYNLTYNTGRDANGNIQPQGKGNANWVWKDAYTTDAYYTWLEFTYDWVNTERAGDITITSDNINQFIETVTVTQAIAYDRFVYSSSLVNEWDGVSLTLDEENGAILSTMIAAGTKDYNNRFTGVMLGNWSAKGDDSLEQSGIYGYQAGAQSFAFLDNGTGFIGPAGAGRIQFDGRNALISNSDKTCYLNLNPNTDLKRDIDSEYSGWNTDSNRGYSQYFLYCKVPADVSWTFKQNTVQKLAWADSFMIDPENNYFLVDPQHGVLTSGGIISKYGKIGQWYIDETGLYQSYKAPETDNDENNNSSRFMYLGMPNWNQSDLVDHYNPKSGQIEKMNPAEIAWAVYQQKLIDNNSAMQSEIDGTQDISYAERLISSISEYLDYAAFAVDVYHYYNNVDAIKANVKYFNAALDIYDALPEEEQAGGYKLFEILTSNGTLELYKHYVLSYEEVNKYCHNHYTNRVKSGAQYGTFPNLSTMFGISTCGYAPSGLSLSYSDADATYNQIGDRRYFSYTRASYNTWINRITLASNFSLTSPSFSAYELLNMVAEEDRSLITAPQKSDFVYQNFVTIGRSCSFNMGQALSQVNANYVEPTELRNVVHDLTLLTDYGDAIYNLIIYNLLIKGLTILQNEDVARYNTAMNKINALGGLDRIKNDMSEVMEDQYTELYDEATVARINEERQRGIKQKYDTLALQYKKEWQEDLKKAYTQNDKDKFAIYCGYTDPFLGGVYSNKKTQLFNPLFAVKWDGYMIARQGKIGKDSPWYISDAGLTQTNNFGTIFLGSPDQDGSYGEAESIEFPTRKTSDTNQEYLTTLKTVFAAKIPDNDSRWEPLEGEKVWGEETIEQWNEDTQQYEYISTAGWVSPEEQIDINKEDNDEYTTFAIEYLRGILENSATSYHNENKTKFVDEFGNLITTNENPYGASKNVLLPNGSKLSDGKKVVLKDSIKISRINLGKYHIIDPEASDLITNGVFDSNKYYPYASDVTLIDTNNESISGDSSSQYYDERLKYLGPEAYGEYGNFAIYAGTKSKGIQFGVRLDGTVYMSRAQLTGVRITGSSGNGLSLQQTTTLNQTVGDPDISTCLTVAYKTIIQITGRFQEDIIDIPVLDSSGSYVLNENGERTYKTVPYKQAKQIYESNRQLNNFMDAQFNTIQTHEIEVAVGGIITVENGRLIEIQAGSDNQNSILKLIDYEENEFTATEDYNYETEITEYDTHLTIVDSDGTHRWYKVIQKRTVREIDPEDYTVNNDDYIQDPVFPSNSCVATNSDDNTIYYNFSQWKCSSTKFGTGRTSKLLKVNAAALIQAIGQNDGVMLGGNLSGWQMSATEIVNYKKQNDITLESISLDAYNGQIRLANSQIVLDGINGVLFIGRPFVGTTGTVSGAYTGSQMYMSGIGIQAVTEDYTQYVGQISDFGSSSYIQTYKAIRWEAGTSVYTGNPTDLVLNGFLEDENSNDWEIILENIEYTIYDGITGNVQTPTTGDGQPEPQTGQTGTDIIETTQTDPWQTISSSAYHNLFTYDNNGAIENINWAAVLQVMTWYHNNYTSTDSGGISPSDASASIGLDAKVIEAIFKEILEPHSYGLIEEQDDGTILCRLTTQGHAYRYVTEYTENDTDGYIHKLQLNQVIQNETNVTCDFDSNQYVIAYANHPKNVVNPQSHGLPTYTDSGIRLSFLKNVPNWSERNANLGLVDGACCFSPLTTNSMLGDPQHRWVLYSHKVYIDNDEAATLTYVNDADKILQDNIIAVNNKAAEALSLAASAMVTAMEALQKAIKNAENIKKAIADYTTKIGNAMDALRDSTYEIYRHYEHQMGEVSSVINQLAKDLLSEDEQNYQSISSYVSSATSAIQESVNSLGQSLSSLSSTVNGKMEADAATINTLKQEKAELQTAYDKYRGTYKYITGKEKCSTGDCPDSGKCSGKQKCCDECK